MYLDFEFDENITHRSSICKKKIKTKLEASRSGGDEEDLFSFMGGMDGIDYSSQHYEDSKIFSQSYSPQTKSLSSPISLDPSSSSFKQENNFVEHPLGEHPSRTLFVRNISSILFFFF
jgi:hypothetical protein